MFGVRKKKVERANGIEDQEEGMERWGGEGGGRGRQRESFLWGKMEI